MAKTPRRGLADPLALEEVGVGAGRMEDARLGKLLGHLPGTRPTSASIRRTRDALVDERPRDRDSGLAGAEDDDVVDRGPRLRRRSRLHSRAASGEPMTMIRSPGWIDSSPRGTIIRSPRMMLATLESAGIAASRSGRPTTVVEPATLGHVELDHLDLAVGEDVRLPRRRDADDARDRVRGLELGRDDEVDVELALAPDLEVLDVRRSDDRLRLAARASWRTSRRRC